VLIPPDAKKALQYIVDPEVRKRAGIKPTNKYMFATKGMNRQIFFVLDQCWGNLSAGSGSVISS